MAKVDKLKRNGDCVPKRTLWVKKEFFDLIVSGNKTLEIRVAFPVFKLIKRGDLINLNNRAMIRIKDVRAYPDFETMLSHEKASQILPGSNQEKVLGLLKSLYPPQKEKLGVVVFEIEITV